MRALDDASSSTVTTSAKGRDFLDTLLPLSTALSPLQSSRCFAIADKRREFHIFILLLGWTVICPSSLGSNRRYDYEKCLIAGCHVLNSSLLPKASTCNRQVLAALYNFISCPIRCSFVSYCFNDD